MLDYATSLLASSGFLLVRTSREQILAKMALLATMNRTLDPLFRPKAVALVGASANPTKIGNIALRNLMSRRFKFFPVNPNETEIMGVKCYRSIGEIPDEIDLALIVLPAELSIGALKESVREGVKFVVVTASGFGESGINGKSLEDELRASVAGTGTRLLGPNSMGVFVPDWGLDTCFIPKERSKRPRRGGLAIVSQSGAVSVSSLEKAEAAGIGVSICIGLGNRVDINENEVLQFLSDDERTKCIAMYLESLSDGLGFVRLCRGIVPRKPVVALMAGRTQSGRAAAGSHTGSMAASSESLVGGVLSQCGVVQAFDEEELVDYAKCLSMVDHINGERVCVVASAGGYGVIASDLIESREHGVGLRMARLSDSTASALRQVVPAYSSVCNPVDLTASVTDDMYDSVLEILDADEGVDVILMSLELEPPNVTENLVDVAADHSSEGRVPIVVAAFGGSRSGWLMRRLQNSGVLAYPTISRAAKAIGALSRRGQVLRRLK